MVNFSEKLKYMIRLRNMTVEQFGDEIGMVRQTVYDLMKKTVIPDDIMSKICQVLKVDAEYFTDDQKYPVNAPAYSANYAESTTELKKTIDSLNQQIRDKNLEIGLLKQDIVMKDENIRSLIKSNEILAKKIPELPPENGTTVKTAPEKRS